MIAAACAAPPSMPPSQPPAARYAPHRLFHDIRAELAPRDPRTEVPGAIGLIPLRDTVLGDSSREVRLWIGEVLGYPHRGLIVREEAGRTTGWVVRHWRPPDPPSSSESPEPGQYDIDQLIRYYENGRCSDIRATANVVGCIVRFRGEPDWAAVMRRIDSIDVWTLPDQRAVPDGRMAFLLHGWRLAGEFRIGDRYSAFDYIDPQTMPNPEGRRALALMLLVDSLARLGSSGTADLAFRGRYIFGSDTSDFVDCATGQRRRMSGAVGPLHRLLRDSVWKKGLTAAPPMYVEGFGVLSPVAPATDSVRARRTLFVDSITLNSLKLPAHCR